MKVAARAIAPMKDLMLRSKRVAMRRQSLQAADHALDDVALAVDSGVVIVMDLAVLAGRDDSLGPASSQPFAQGLAVVALVGDELAEGGMASMQSGATLQSWTFPGVSRRTRGRPFASQTA